MDGFFIFAKPFRMCYSLVNNTFKIIRTQWGKVDKLQCQFKTLGALTAPAEQVQADRLSVLCIENIEIL